MNLDSDFTSKRLTVVLHIACWGLLLHLIFDFGGLYHSFYELVIKQEGHIDEAFLLIPLMLILFYFNSHFLLPKLLGKRRVLLYVLMLLLTYLGYILSGFSIYNILLNQGYHFWVDDNDIWDILILSGILITGISTSVGLMKVLQKKSIQNKLTEQERRKAELKYLNAQVNPHFMFNTLNTIYALADEENAPKTKEAILKLSEIMRYPINEGTRAKNSISKEIRFITDYIELQKMRLGTDYPIHFDIKGKVNDKKIAPFLFIPIIENAFKYGISRQNPQLILIELEISVDQLRFKVKNTKTNPSNITSNQMGIQNLKERLDLIYPNNHHIRIEESSEGFVVELTITSD